VSAKPLTEPRPLGSDPSEYEQTLFFRSLTVTARIIPCPFHTRSYTRNNGNTIDLRVQFVRSDPRPWGSGHRVPAF